MNLSCFINVSTQLIDLKEKINSLSFNALLYIPLIDNVNVDDNIKENVLIDIYKICDNQRPFIINLDSIKSINNDCFIVIKESIDLNILQNKIIDLLKEKYNIDYKNSKEYNSIVLLFKDDSKEKISKVSNLIKNISLPKTLLVNRFIILDNKKTVNEIIKTGFKKRKKIVNMTGEDIDMFNERKIEHDIDDENVDLTICDTHQDGA